MLSALCSARKEGDKKNIYALAQKMIRLGLIEPTANK
jgi:hypothetical protein